MWKLTVPLLLSALASTPAAAEIYKWVDAEGRTTYSNVRPGTAAKKVEVVVADDPPEQAAAAAARREQELLERISRLERQMQAPQYVAPVPPANYYPSDYYPAGYYPPGYYYPVGSTRFVVPRRFVHARPISQRSPSVRTASLHHRR